RPQRPPRRAPLPRHVLSGRPRGRLAGLQVRAHHQPRARPEDLHLPRPPADLPPRRADPRGTLLPGPGRGRSVDVVDVVGVTDDGQGGRAEEPVAGAVEVLEAQLAHAARQEVRADDIEGRGRRPEQLGHADALDREAVSLGADAPEVREAELAPRLVYGEPASELFETLTPIHVA